MLALLFAVGLAKKNSPRRAETEHTCVVDSEPDWCPFLANPSYCHHYSTVKKNCPLTCGECYSVWIHTCTCSEGIAATEEDCLESTEKCTSCTSPDFGLDSNNHCVPFVRTPMGPQGPNGPVAPPTAPPALCNCLHGTCVAPQTTCTTCNPGYEAVAGFCDPNYCYCQKGIAASGADCDEDNTEICIDCYDGAVMDGDVCVGICTCDNGTPTEGDVCMGQEHCAQCDDGFHMTPDDKCLPNECICPGGTPVDNCAVDGITACSDCDDGYLMHNTHCFELP